MSAKETVVVLGASDNPERYSNRAVKMLLSHGHAVIPVHPALATVEGVPVVSSLDRIPGPVDTVSLYLSPRHSESQIAGLLALRPARVIFNPGTESPAVKSALEAGGIRCIEACTLVLLSTGQFTPTGRD